MSKDLRTFLAWTTYQFHPKAVLHTWEYGTPGWITGFIEFIFDAIHFALFWLILFPVSYLPIAFYRAFSPSRIMKRWRAD